MEIRLNALKHGIDAADIEHAERNAIRRIFLDDGLEMLIGPAWDGELLEIGVARNTRIVHAMKAREKFLPPR